MRIRLNPGTLRQILDLLASIAVIATCGFLVWSKVGGPASTRPGSDPPAPPSLPTEPISISDAPVKGNRNAKLAIVVYSEFQCPYCASLVRSTLPAIEEKYIRTGRLVMAFRHFPLESIHPQAVRASETAHCAGLQGKFWEMHDSLFANPKALDENALASRAKEVGLNPDPLAECLGGPASTQIKRDLEEGRRLQVAGTPTMFVGATQADGRVKVLRRLVGAVPADRLLVLLDELYRTVT